MLIGNHRQRLVSSLGDRDQAGGKRRAVATLGNHRRIGDSIEFHRMARGGVGHRQARERRSFLGENPVEPRHVVTPDQLNLRPVALRSQLGTAPHQAQADPQCGGGKKIRKRFIRPTEEIRPGQPSKFSGRFTVTWSPSHAKSQPPLCWKTPRIRPSHENQGSTHGHHLHAVRSASG